MVKKKNTTFARSKINTDMRYEVDTFANQHGLEVAECTDSYNGYPSNLRYCLFGFDDIKEAEELGAKFQRILDNEFEDVTVIVYHFRKKDGWHLWQRQNPAYKMYDMELFFSEDDSASPTLTFRNTDVDAFIEERNFIFEDEDYIEDNLNSIGVDEETYRDNTVRIANAIKNLKANEILLYSTSYTDGYYEIAEVETMSYSEDTWTYAIGLLIM